MEYVTIEASPVKVDCHGQGALFLLSCIEQVEALIGLEYKLEGLDPIKGDEWVLDTRNPGKTNNLSMRRGRKNVLVKVLAGCTGPFKTGDGKAMAGMLNKQPAIENHAFCTLIVR